MAGSPKEAGPAGERAAANLKRLRQERGLSYAELARRLEKLGHPIADTGLLKTEKGTRRIDVDDLTALALALEVSPNTLLMPHVDLRSAAERLPLTPRVAGTPEELWTWAQGDVPLPTGLEPLTEERYPGDRGYYFIRAAKPYLTDGSVLSGALDREPGVHDLLADVLNAVRQALDAGLTATDARRAAELAVIASLTSAREADENGEDA